MCNARAIILHMVEGKNLWDSEHKFFPRVTHYYGDITRELMLGGAALMIIAAPLYADSLQDQFLYIIVGAICIVAFAALTSPLRSSIAWIDVVLSATVAVVFGGWAYTGYQNATEIAFIIRDAITLIFLFSFYFSLKTLRAFMLHQVGKPDSAAEFRRMMPPLSPEEIVEESDRINTKEDPLSEEEAMVQKIMHHDDRGD